MQCSVKEPELCLLNQYKDGLCRSHYEAYIAANKAVNKQTTANIPYDDLVNFQWPVWEYKIVSEPKPLIVTKRKKRMDDYRIIWSKPLEDENLHLELALVDTSSNKSILDFVSKHGLLGEGHLSINSFYPQHGDRLQGTIVDEGLDFFISEAKKVKRLVELLKAVKSNSKEEIEKVFIFKGKFNQQNQSRYLFHLKADDKLYQSINYSNKEHSHLTLDAKNLKIKELFLNEVVGGLKTFMVYPGYKFTSNGKVKPTYSTCTLIGAIYLQLYLMVTKRLNYQQCKDDKCGNLFVKTRKNKEYCSDNCSSRTRQRKHYKQTREVKVN
ncbi:MAG: CGNR zinc finger domain-containing protein [Actinobacteria bacterium]|nr:MAG: CGNR zinc finger domain-containing protein [Actinomycetota bacterium]